MYDAHTRFVTVANVASESGDHELHTFDGLVERDEIARMVHEQNPDWWEDPEYVYVDNIEQIRFIG